MGHMDNEQVGPQSMWDLLVASGRRHSFSILFYSMPSFMDILSHMVREAEKTQDLQLAS